MKLKIVIMSIVGLLSLAVSGYSVLNILDARSLRDASNKELNDVQSEADRLTLENQEIMDKLESTGKSALLSNIDIARAFSEVNGATITEIIAYHFNGTSLDETLTVTAVEDVAFFTDSIDVIRYKFDVQDKMSFVSDVATKPCIQNYANFDFDSGVAVIDVISTGSIAKGITSYQVNEENLSTPPSWQPVESVEQSEQSSDGQSEEHTKEQTEEGSDGDNVPTKGNFDDRDDLGGELDIGD